jgi:hypothetical protein
MRSLALQAYLSVVNLKCATEQIASNEADVGRANVGTTLVVNLLLPLLYILAMCARVSTNVCVELLVFEKMLASSIFVDCRVPDFKRTANYRYFVYAFGFIVAWYFVCSTAAISVSAHATSIEVQYAFRIIAGNVLALAGGVYFIYSIFCEGPVLGRLSSFSMRDRSPETLRKLAAMKVAAMPQLMHAAKAMVCAAEIARRSGSSGHCSALRERLRSPAHLYSVMLQVNSHSVQQLEHEAFGPAGKIAAFASAVNPKMWLVK